MNQVETFFRHLVDVLSKSDTDRLRSPIQVSELYQTIVPYRRHRAALGFDTNEDYEMAILRFLAGEGGFASLDPPEAQETLMEEARAINPTPGAFREFAAAKVYLNSGAVRTVTDANEAYAPPQEPEDEAETFEKEAIPEAFPATVEASAPTAWKEPEDFEKGGAVPDTPDEDPSQTAEADQSPTTAAAPTPAPSPQSGAAPMCHYCGGSLPPEREVHFCPYCGRDVSVISCPSCGAELEVGWLFCITCGDPAEQ